MAQSPMSMLMTTISGSTLPQRSVPQCRTCQSPYRAQIENAVLSGRTYVAIANWLSDLETGPLPHPSNESLADHVNKNHLPLPETAQRRLIERRAVEIGKDLDDAATELVDYVVAQQMIVKKGFERLQAGEIEPTVAEMLAASRQLHVIESSTQGGIDQEAWVNAMTAVVDTVRESVDAATWEQIGSSLSQHPVLRALANRKAEKELGA